MAKRRTSVKGALAAWQDENPLRVWRMKQPPEGWNCSVLARQLSVSHTAVASWEKGERLPVIDTFSKIEKLTGISTVQWIEWYDRKPEKE